MSLCNHRCQPFRPSHPPTLGHSLGCCVRALGCYATCCTSYCKGHRVEYGHSHGEGHIHPGRWKCWHGTHVARALVAPPPRSPILIWLVLLITHTQGRACQDVTIFYGSLWLYLLHCAHEDSAWLRGRETPLFSPCDHIWQKDRGARMDAR